MDFDKWYKKVQTRKLEYTKQVVKTHEDLFIMILRQYADFAISNDAVPIFVPLSDYKSAMYEYNNDSIDKRIIQRSKSIENLNVVDPRTSLVDSMEEGNLYHGTHHSPKANKFIAEEIADFIQSHDN